MCVIVNLCPPLLEVHCWVPFCGTDQAHNIIRPEWSYNVAYLDIGCQITHYTARSWTNAFLSIDDKYIIFYVVRVRMLNSTITLCGTILGYREITWLALAEANLGSLTIQRWAYQYREFYYLVFNMHFIELSKNCKQIKSMKNIIMFISCIVFGETVMVKS